MGAKGKRCLNYDKFGHIVRACPRKNNKRREEERGEAKVSTRSSYGWVRFIDRKLVIGFASM